MLRRVASGSHRPALQVPNDGDWERERGELPPPLLRASAQLRLGGGLFFLVSNCGFLSYSQLDLRREGHMGNLRTNPN